MFPHRGNILFQLILILALGLSACASPIGIPATVTPSLPTPTLLPPTPTPPPLAATVNDEWITEEEFLAEVERYRAAQQSLDNEVSTEVAAQKVLDELIVQVLLAQAARAEGFEMTEANLESRIDLLKSDAGGADVFATWLSAYGYSDESFKSALKRAAEAAWMRDKIITAVSGTTEQVHAQQILLYNDETAQKVAGQLSAGANFADLAALYDPNTAGELGWFPRGYLLEPALDEAAFRLEPGQYSDVIETEVGFHILMVVEHNPQYPLAPDAYLVMQENALQDWLAQRRAESDIVLAP